MQLTSMQSTISPSVYSLARGVEQSGISIAQLSSGNRLVNAKIDVASMAASTSLQTRTISLRSALVNLAQADSLLQVRDGALSQVQEMLFRMNSLATTANNGALTSAERSFLQIEMNELRDETSRILKETNFNGVKLFSGKADTVKPATTQPELAAVQTLFDIRTLQKGTHKVSTATGTFDAFVDNHINANTKKEEQWLLIGRGREGWSFEQEGQGNRDEVSKNLGTSAAFDPKVLDATTINELLREAGVTMDQVEIRIKRAENLSGTRYQEARFELDSSDPHFSWNMFDMVESEGKFSIIDSSLGADFVDTTSNLRDTSSTVGTDAANNYRRMFTWPWTGHSANGELQRGFSFGTTVRGNNNDKDFIWDNTNNGASGIPYTEMYIRVKDGVTPLKETQLDAFNNDPRSIEGLAAWYDAADIDGDGLNEGAGESGRTGNVMNVWKEKTGNGNDIIRQNGNPLLNNQINGLNTVTFSNNRRGQALDSLGGRTEEMQVFYVSRENSTRTTYLSLNGFNTNNSAVVDDDNLVRAILPNNDRRILFDAGNTTQNYRSELRDYYDGLTNRDVVQVGDVTLANLHVSVKEGHTGISINGGEYTDVSDSATAIYTKGGLRLGWGQSGNNHDVAEIIMFNRKLNSEETARIEQYLHNKWAVKGFTEQGFERNNPTKDISLTVKELQENGSIITQVNKQVYSKADSFELLGGRDIVQIDRDTGNITIKNLQAVQEFGKPMLSFQVRMKGSAFGIPHITQRINLDVSDYLGGDKVLSFQAGSNVANQLKIDLHQLDDVMLFSGSDLSISTQENARATSEVIKNAIDTITGQRAENGALQARVDILSVAQRSELHNQSTAYSALADTDIASTSTLFAQQTVKNNINIAMQVQANTLRSESITSIMLNAISIVPLVSL
jgi:flagellin-like hook-associated protein FlgL